MPSLLHTPHKKHPKSARHIALNAWMKFDTGLYDQQPSTVEALLLGEADYQQLSPSDQGFARAMLLFAMRHYGQLEKLILLQFDKKPAAKLWRKLSPFLMLGAAQMIIMKLPAHAVCNEMTALVKKFKLVGLDRLANRILRKIAAHGAADLPDPIHNLPAFFQTMIAQNYGAEINPQLALALLEPPPLDLSFKSAAARDEFIKISTAQAMKYDMIKLGNQLRLMPAPAAVTALPLFHQDAWWVQDFAAQLPIACLESKEINHKRTLDMCAAPGGKSLQLASLGAQVTAIDISNARLKRLNENRKRLCFQANIAIKQANMLTLDLDALNGDQGDSGFDLIILDAPCSASGTVRRNPEILRKFTNPDDYQHQLDQLIAMQRALALKAQSLLNPHGILLYIVCSLDVQEGEAQCQHIINHPDIYHLQPSTLITDQRLETLENIAKTAPISFSNLEAGASLRLLPHDGMDGFFFAKFTKIG
ncbi:MAG: RsmB/NOP family class I SAM-dependent RNA methyltransferase [Alphaproteobacteria bacterium]